MRRATMGAASNRQGRVFTMHTVELLDCALSVAEALGYGIRHEWLGGATGGVCRIAGQPWLFVDLARNPIEQLDQVVSALQLDPRWNTLKLPAGLRDYAPLRHAA